MSGAGECSDPQWAHVTSTHVSVVLAGTVDTTCYLVTLDKQLHCWESQSPLKLKLKEQTNLMGWLGEFHETVGENA